MTGAYILEVHIFWNTCHNLGPLRTVPLPSQANTFADVAHMVPDAELPPLPGRATTKHSARQSDNPHRHMTLHSGHYSIQIPNSRQGTGSFCSHGLHRGRFRNFPAALPSEFVLISH
jgi:hypothetical protein